MLLACVKIINVYQKFISPVLGPRCRFYPTCSEYTKQCLLKYETGPAVTKSVKRLFSCHPFHPGGVDIP